MALTHKALKDRQRKERDQHPQGLALRVHRALSWLHRAEQCGDDADAQFLFLWIAFNAAYSNETGESRPRDRWLMSEFLRQLVSLDTSNRLESLLWAQYPHAIRVLLDNRHVFQPYWDHLNGIPDKRTWEERFRVERKWANAALARRNTRRLLHIVLSRLYTLRNQLVHGGSTWNSTVNREQLRDGNRILGTLVPVMIEIMMDNPGADWGVACYPVVRT